jgi:hypothetical protein
MLRVIDEKSIAKYETQRHISSIEENILKAEICKTDGLQ